LAGFIHWNSNSITLTSITGCGGTFTLVKNPTTGGSQRAAGFYAANIAGGSCVVTATFSGAVTSKWIVVHEVSGIIASSPLDGSGLRYQSSPGRSANAVSSRSITTSTAGDYIFAATSDFGNNATYTPGSGFTGRFFGNQGLRSEDRILAAAGAVSGTFTSSANHTQNLTLVMAFKPVPPTPFDFSISNNGTVSVVQGSSVTNGITTTLLQGVATAVTFNTSGLPANATATFSPTSCSPGCTTTLTINTLLSTPSGTSTITVTGASASATHTTTFSLTVTPDTTPPLISAVSATDVTSLGATIIWTTNEAANSQVDYGTSISYGQTSTLNTALTLSHSVPLSGLTPSTLYYFQVMSTDAAGNVATPVAGTFMTTDVPVISLVNHSESASCGNSTTCSVTLKGPVTQFNFLVITAWAINPVHAVSISSGGTFVDGNVRNGTASARGFLSGGYVLSTTATAGPIVVTFSGATGGAQVNIREYSVSSGSLAFDAAVDALYSPAVNPFATPTLTLTGTNDLIVSWAGASTNITSVASPYGNADIANDETGSGTADLLNTTSGVPATWTAATSATTTVAASMAFGVQPQPCNSTVVMDGSGGVAGSPLTIASLTASMQGTVGNGSTSDNWSWRLVNTSSALTWSTAAHHPLTTPIRFCSGGNNYVDLSNLGVQYNTSSGSGQYAHFLFPGTWEKTLPFASNTATVGIWFYTSLPQNATVNADVLTLFGSGSGYVNLILYGAGSNLVVECEVPNTTCTTTKPVIQSNTWYWLTLQYNYGGTHYGAVYDSSMNLVGSFNATDPSNTPPGRLTFGYVDTTAVSPNAVMQFDKLKFCYIGNCTFPVLP
jgi:hypothetical protein